MTFMKGKDFDKPETLSDIEILRILKDKYFSETPNERWEIYKLVIWETIELKNKNFRSAVKKLKDVFKNNNTWSMRVSSNNEFVLNEIDEIFGDLSK